MFDYQLLENFAECYAPQYWRNRPYAHAVIDGVIHKQHLGGLVDCFPPPSDPKWYRYNNAFEKKLAIDASNGVPEYAERLLLEANSGRFVGFLEALTGVEGLIPDPHYRGGGLHQIETGGKLDIHADFNWNARLKLDRRVNVLLYFNDPWHDAWGGHLELWDREMTGCHAKIAPVLNRMVVFNSDDTTYHGHPEPLNTPSDVTRKSIALYYYTNGRPEGEKTGAHSTLYQRRPEDPMDVKLDEMRKQRAKGRLADG